MPVLFEDGRWHMAFPGPISRDPIEATAHKALRRRLAALTGVDLPTDGACPIQLQLGSRWEASLPDAGSALEPTGFRFRVTADAITLCGGSPKGTLNAAYELLERLGCRWPVAGPDGPPAIQAARLEIAEGDAFQAPAFPRITFFQDLRTLRDYSDENLAAVQEQNDRDLVTWMGRLRFTGLYGNLPEAPEPWGEAARRGIGRQAGGHVLPHLLPRKLFAERPELFPMNEAGERFVGNICASNREALEVVCHNARRYVEETGARVLHLWGEDVLSGKWCACPDCRRMSVQDQYLTVVNAVADCLAEPFPYLRVAYIAYHDTLTPKITGEPRPNVVLLFAPRQRCYRHGIGDPTCPRNAAIYAGLLEYRRIFGEGRLHTFEYYGDALLWCSAAIVLPRMIIDDLRLYRAAGVADSGCLMFGGYSWFSHPLNLYTFARGSWDTRWSAAEIVEEFVCAIYPGAEDAMQRYYRDLEDAGRLLVERSDWFYRVPESDPAAARQLWEDTAAAEAAWEDLTGTLAAALAAASPSAGVQLVRERQALRLSQHLVRAHRQLLWAEGLRVGLDARDESAGDVCGSGERAAALEALQRVEAEVLSARRILHDLSPYSRGSWGAEGHGEPRRLTRFLQDRIRRRIDALTGAVAPFVEQASG